MICKIFIGREIYTKIGIIFEDFNMFIANRKDVFIYCWLIIDLLLIFLLISCWFKMTAC